MPRADRLFALVQLLSGPGRRSLEELARALETSSRSIYRDLADLERRGVPVERTNGRYRLVEGSGARFFPLTERERLLLALVLENPHLRRQDAFRTTLRQLRAKFAANSRGERGPVAALAGPDRSGIMGPLMIETIENAIRGCHSISFLYTSLSPARSRWRGIDPWVMLHRSEAWYLLGRCHIHDEPRTFRLDRIREVLPIGGSFERSDTFDAERWFQHSWGVEASEEAHEAVIVFDASVAPLIEHGMHHPAEKKLRRQDGRLEYRIRVGPLDELARWIVGFAGKAVAEAPHELIERVRQIAGAAAEAHGERRASRAAARVARAPGGRKGR